MFDETMKQLKHLKHLKQILFRLSPYITRGLLFVVFQSYLMGVSFVSMVCFIRLHCPFYSYLGSSHMHLHDISIE